MAYFSSTSSMPQVRRTDDELATDSPRTLNVAVVGAGIAGLTAAIAFRQQGHRVTLFEHPEVNGEDSAFIDLPPYANGVLRRFGVFVEANGGSAGPIRVDGQASVYASDGMLRRNEDLASQRGLWQHPWHRTSQKDLLAILRNKAFDPTLRGLPIALHSNSRVQQVDPNTGTLTLEGEEFSSDLIIGADGLKSKLRAAVHESPIKLVDSGKEVSWFTIDRHQLISDPDLAQYFTELDRSISWIGGDKELGVFPLSNGTSLAVSLTHPATDGRHMDVSEVFKDFHPYAQKLVALAKGSSLRSQILIDLPELSKWSKGRLVLIGEAVRRFGLSHVHNAGQALEDAAALAALFPTTVPSEEVPQLLELYQEFRQPRSRKVLELTKSAPPESADGESAAESRINPLQQISLVLQGYDAWDATQIAERRYFLKHNRKNWLRQPLEIGLQGSLRQRTNGELHRPQNQLEWTRYAIRFKTSRTVLDGYLPDGYSFATPGSIAEATWGAGLSDRMDWLGGGGYLYSTMTLHGVNFTKKDGSKVHGSYLLMMIENSTDAILGGVLDSGMTKLFADIDIRRSDHKAIVSLSWRGFQVMELHLEGLHAPLSTSVSVPAQAPASDANGQCPSTTIPPPAKETGMFWERYVGAVGQPGVADVQYCVFSPYNSPDESGAEIKVTKTEVATSGSVVYHQGDELTLPTWHSMVKRLSEVPFLEFVSGSVVSGTGSPDNRGLKRLD